MTEHVHAFTRHPAPAAMEDDDWRPSCECGRREPDHEHQWKRVWLDDIPLWTRCTVCNVEGTVTTTVEPKL